MPTNCLSVFDHFVKLALKGLNTKITTRGVIKKAVLENFTIFTGKYVLESILNKVAGFQACPTELFSCEHCEIFKNTDFEDYLRTTASVNLRRARECLVGKARIFQNF